MGASHDAKPAVGGDGSGGAQLHLTNRLRSGSVHLPVSHPGVLRRHHLLLTIVTLVLTLALLVQALTSHSSASAILATRRVIGRRIPAVRGGFSLTPRRESITAEGWIRDILSAGQRRRAGAVADEPAGHPLRHRPSAHPEGAFYTAIPAPGAWLDAAAQEQAGAKPLCGVLPGTTLDPKGLWLRDTETGHLVWEPSHCQLRRLTGQQARQCLAGRHLAFVGDSVTRFQFVSLVHFLTQLVYPERYGRDDAPSLVIPHQYGAFVGFDWDVYYKILMNTLSTGVNASIEAEGNMKHSMGKEDLGFTLSGMRRAGWLPGQLAPIQLSLNFTGFSQVTNFEDTAIQNLHWAGARADAVVANVGLWWSKHVLSLLMGRTDTTGPAGELLGVDAGPVIRRIIEGGLAGAASRAGRRPRMIWKTTTSVGLRHMPDEAEMLNIYSPVGLALFDMKALADIGDLGNPWEVMDVHAITEAAKDQRLRLQWDVMHFLPIVYEQMNDLLLNMLCDEHNRWAS